MPALVATVIYALVIAGLFWMDRDRKARVSAALWIPVVWVFLAGSRLVSEWLNPGLSLDNPDQYLEGSPLDRLVLMGLLADVISANRKLLEDLLYRVRKIELRERRDGD